MESDPTPPTRVSMRDGQICQGDAVALAVGEASAFTGRGVFETIPIYRGRPFALSDHLDRLAAGAARLDLRRPADTTMREWIDRLLGTGAFREIPLARLRITLLHAGAADGTTRSLLEIGPPPPHPRQAAAITLPFTRNETGALAGCKTLNYGENDVARARVAAAGADEGIFANSSGEVCEGIWSNFFARIDDAWRTPPLSSGCLPGVTRARLLELGDRTGIPIREAPLPVSCLERIDAAFFTSSMREIQPASSVDGRPLTEPEELETLRRAWRELVRSETSN